MKELQTDIDYMFELLHMGQWEDAGNVFRTFKCSGQEFHEIIQKRGESDLFKLSMLGFYNREMLKG